MWAGLCSGGRGLCPHGRGCAWVGGAVPGWAGLSPLGDCVRGGVAGGGVQGRVSLPSFCAAWESSSWPLSRGW